MKRNAGNVEGFLVRTRKGHRATLDGMSGNLRTADGLKLEKSTQPLFTTYTPDDDIDGDLTASLADLPGYDNLDQKDDLMSENPMNEKQVKKLLKKSSKKKAGRAKKPKSKKKIVLIILLILLLLGGGFFAVTQWLFPSNTFEGGWWNALSEQQLKKDDNGRTNILIFGTAPSDYDGPLLADTILVLSINQDDKSAYMVSLPRDLWVEHNCPNPSMNTTAGKLNETYRCVSLDDESKSKEGSNEFRKKAGEITGLDVQYYAKLSWKGVEDTVNALDGIDVTIQSDDPRGIYDVATGIKFTNGEKVHMDGELALKFARARGAFGGYGLEGSNFSRELHQQQVIKAMQEKAMANGMLSDPSTILNLLSTLDKNLQTNFASGEVRSLAKLAQDINADKIVSLPLVDTENGINLVRNDAIGGASVVVPTAGTFDYSEIKEYIRTKTSADPVVREAAVLDIMNGSDTEGLATKKAEELKSKGYSIGQIANAPEGKYGAVTIYQLSKKKTATAEALEKLFDVEAKTKLPFQLDTEADFVIIFGK
ncbi:MAG: LCP family protein [Candidatus Nomurabacteria bacterium]|jgi:LCP family protein required for cell wall assembly|nr:LCP family protein [Candidatus Nomurabacteria bacterium]